MITQNYKLNIIPKIESSVRGITPPPTVNVSQYDKGLRTLVFDLYDGANRRLTIQEGQTAKIYGKKPDANVFEYDMTIGEDMRSVSIVLQEQMAVVAGCVKCEVRIFDGTSTVGSANFILAVEEAPVGADEAYSESELPEIDNLLYGGEVGQVFTKTRTGARWALIGTDSGLMMKSEYDPNDDGSVLKADHADDADTVDGHTVARDVLANEYTNEQIDDMIEQAGTVKTVNSVQPDQNGNVQLSKSDIGLGNVDNTSDANKPISTATQAALDRKVDKVTGKGLSTNDYTDADKAKLGDLPTDAELTAELAGKVDKETGKGLSSNDFTTEEKNKLAGIEAGAEVNVQANWNETDQTADSFIKNKPSIPSKTSDLTNDSGFVTDAAMQSALDQKVDKVPGKQLSTEDFTSAEKTKLAGIEAGAQFNTITGVKGDAEATYRTGDVNITKANIGLGNVDNTSDLDKPVSTATQAALDRKVDKVTGKGLSTNDYTDADKAKLGDLPTDAELTAELAGKVDKETGKGLSSNDFTTEEKNKLAGIEAGAEVNVQANWNETDQTADSFIKNKPSIPSKTSDLTNDSGFVTDAAMQSALDQKVDKVPGKQLSTEDFTSVEKTKLAGIEAGAQVNVITGVKGSAEPSYRSGNVSISKTDIGLGNVDDTSDLDKPVSTATQTALANQKYFYIDSEGYGCINYDLFQTA